MSSSVLSQRLSELRAAGVLERTRAGYALSQEGERLLDALGGLQAWSERWAQRAARRG